MVPVNAVVQSENDQDTASLYQRLTDINTRVDANTNHSNATDHAGKAEPQ